MYIYCKVNDPDHTFYNAFYEEWCGNTRRMYSYAYKGYCVVMTEETAHSLFMGDAHTIERFWECVKRWEESSRKA